MIKLKNILNESEESDKRFAEYIYKSYIEDSPQTFSAAGIAYSIMMDTDSKVNPFYIKRIMKQYYDMNLK